MSPPFLFSLRWPSAMLQKIPPRIFWPVKELLAMPPATIDAEGDLTVFWVVWVPEFLWA